MERYSVCVLWGERIQKDKTLNMQSSPYSNVACQKLVNGLKLSFKLSDMTMSLPILRIWGMEGERETFEKKELAQGRP